MIAIAIAISNTTFKASITFVNKILIAGIMDEAVDLAGGGQVGDVVNPPSPVVPAAAEGVAAKPKWKGVSNLKRKKRTCGPSLARGKNIPKTSAAQREQLRQSYPHIPPRCKYPSYPFNRRSHKEEAHPQEGNKKTAIYCKGINFLEFEKGT